MIVVARADRKHSLNAMWRAYERATSSTSVGHAFLNARYYNGANGQFLSEDAAHLAIGNTQQLKQLTGQSQHVYLSDPQQMNSYSYGKNNPMKNSDPSGNGVLEGTISGGAMLGGTIGIDIDTTSRSMQLIAGPWVGPSLGGRLQGSWDPNATLDAEGAYLQTSANITPFIGASVSRQAPINFLDPQKPFLGPQSDASWQLSLGLSVGVTNTLLFKSSPYYFGGGNKIPPQTNWSSLQGSSISRLSSSVVGYASLPGANLTNPNFAGALKAINMANAPWLSTAVSTPSTITNR